jgi:ribosomal protein S18 acetylase RimI-like enzyme
MEKDLEFQVCAAKDIEKLIAIGVETYSDTFASMNTAETMADYLAMAFDRDKIKAEIDHPDSTFLFLFVHGELAGYLNVNENEAQTDLRESGGLEIERIYLRKRFQGRGLWRVLLEKGLETAREKQKQYAWLGVWEGNTKAIGFYERAGFRKIGIHDFFMGTERQTDFVMRKDLRRRRQGSSGRAESKAR